MSSFEREFNSAVEAVERDVFINLVCENPQLTLAELTRLGKGKFANLLGSISVGDIIAGSRNGRGGPIYAHDGGSAHDAHDGGSARKSSQGQAKGKGKGKSKAVNTRTPEGRRAYDNAVYNVVRSAPAPIKAPEITAQVGGTALQVRKSLARLIEAGQVTWEGKARGMRYSACD